MVCRKSRYRARTTGRNKWNRRALPLLRGSHTQKGVRDDALKTAQAAAALEEKTGKHPVTPGAPLPARELLGDMLLEMGRNAEALAAYEASLLDAPNRFNSLYGAARAAQLSQNMERARALYTTLLAQCVEGSTRPELVQARKFMGD